MSHMAEFGRHEMLHMTLFLAGAVEEQLIDHEQVKSRPEWLALAKTACRALTTFIRPAARSTRQLSESDRT